MVFGIDLHRNVRRLVEIVPQIEIVLFHTPDRHNIPSQGELARVRALARPYRTRFSVHLPASLQIASKDLLVRQQSVDLALRIMDRLAVLAPTYFVMHVPLTPPTLTFIPGSYRHARDAPHFDAWRRRARTSLQTLGSGVPEGSTLLVENLNFSPVFLEPLWREGLCGLCLDLGHLLLGHEPVEDHLRRYGRDIVAIHLHGVRGHEEHLALDVVDPARLARWVDRLRHIGFKGVVNLEVFDPGDLDVSLRALGACVLEK
jgi:sugar phosphate isomerase/epimerase